MSMQEFMKESTYDGVMADHIANAYYRYVNKEYREYLKTESVNANTTVPLTSKQFLQEATKPSSPIWIKFLGDIAEHHPWIFDNCNLPGEYQ